MHAVDHVPDDAGGLMENSCAKSEALTMIWVIVCGEFVVQLPLRPPAGENWQATSVAPGTDCWTKASRVDGLLLARSSESTNVLPVLVSPTAQTEVSARAESGRVINASARKGMRAKYLDRALFGNSGTQYSRTTEILYATKRYSPSSAHLPQPSSRLTREPLNLE